MISMTLHHDAGVKEINLRVCVCVCAYLTNAYLTWANKTNIKNNRLVKQNVSLDTHLEAHHADSEYINVPHRNPSYLARYPPPQTQGLIHRVS